MQTHLNKFFDDAQWTLSKKNSIAVSVKNLINLRTNRFYQIIFAHEFIQNYNTPFHLGDFDNYSKKVEF